MKPVYLAAIGMAALACAGEYFYLAHSLEAGAHQMINTLNASLQNKETIQVGSIDTSPLSGTIVLHSVEVASKINPNEAAHIKTATLKIGSYMDSRIKCLEADLSGLAIKNSKADLTLKHITLAGPDLIGSYQQIRAKKLAMWPLDQVEVNGFNFRAKDQSHVSFKLNTFRFKASYEGAIIDEMLIDKLAFHSPSQHLNVDLDRYQLKGLGIGILLNGISEDVNRMMADPTPEKREKAFISVLDQATQNFLFFDGLIIKGLQIDLPTGLKVGLKNLYVRDLEHDSHYGFVMGGRVKIEDMLIQNISSISPQAAQLAKLADFNDFRFNMDGEGHYDAKSGHVGSHGSMKADGLFHIQYENDFMDETPEKIWKRMLALKEQKISEILHQNYPQTLEEAKDEMWNDIFRTHTGYYAGFKAKANVKDLGGIKRGLIIASAVQNKPVEALRTQVTSIVLDKLHTFLGTAAPGNLDKAVTNFFAASSIPLQISARNRERLDENTLSTTTKDNWQRLVKIEVEQQPTSGETKSR